MEPSNPAAAGILYRAGGRVLLVKRAPDSVQGGTWSFPAGKIEEGESSRAAAEREFTEETAFQVATPLSLLMHKDNFTLFTTEGGQFAPVLNEEHTGYVWAEMGDLPAPLHPGVDTALALVAGTAMDRRHYDMNGWFEVQDNPISKAGIFDYLGKSINAPIPDKMYRVWRPEEELADPATIESMRLLPFTDEHALLGSADAGNVPAEEKGVHGVIGEQIYFKAPYLYANLKVFSESLANLISSGKKELSAGLRCIHEFTPGEYNGQRYDAIQRTLRGNHIALVREGRVGHEVAVLDHREQLTSFQFTCDAKELTNMAEEKKDADGKTEKKEMTLAEAQAAIEQIMPMLTKMQESITGMTAAGAAMDKEDDDKKDDKEKGEKKEGAAMDAAITAAVAPLQAKIETMQKEGFRAIMGEMKARDALADKLSGFVGTFDHAEKTLAEVAAYGVEKLKLPHVKGQEIAALEGYLHDRAPPSASHGFAMDAAAAKTGGDEIDSYAGNTIN